MEPADLLIAGDWVLTMDAERRMVRDGAVAVRGERIVDVGSQHELVRRWAAPETIGGGGCVVLPGLINAHQHLTGDRLARSTIPDSLTSGEAIFGWAVPIHRFHRADDDELSATLSLVEAVGNGITFTVEAGTVAHPAAVLAAYDRVGVGGTLGTWGWDVDPNGATLPSSGSSGSAVSSGSVEEVVARQAAVLDLTADHPRVDGWVTLVGHDLMSDELAVAASELARARATGLTFHLSPNDADPTAYLARTGVRPAVHLDHLGVLGPHVLLAHGVHLDDEELDVVIQRDVAIAYCPWAYLRLGQGVTHFGRHAELVERGGRLAIGCDAENAGDAVDILRAAALAAGLAKDTRVDPTRFGAHTVLELATITGAAAIGMDHEIGSLEAGKRADVVVIDRSGAEWVPHGPDPVLGLVWASDGRAVSDVVASGRHVVAGGRCSSVDVAELRERAQEHHRRLLRDAGLDPQPVWPVT